MPKGVTDPTKPKCSKCGIRQAGYYPGGICRFCYDQQRKVDVITRRMPEDLAERLKQAQITGDWKVLADSLSQTVKDVATGKVKATAAQAGMLKHILDRAYGRVSKSQEEKAPALGLVILPTLGRDNSEDLHICPQCSVYHNKEHKVE